MLHPRVAVLLGVERHWHFPLLFCRALSTAPAVWWGLRCALTFLGELLLVEGKEEIEAAWSVEKRFRVTEVFLAVLWVGKIFFVRSNGYYMLLEMEHHYGLKSKLILGKCCSSAWLSFYFTDCLMSRWYGPMKLFIVDFS